ncbi:BF3164 family lipoprotein [Phocaeicola coprophilus]|uniref:BF3164 family lipoprotein n=1 Tax=Phocaeicola coprophilus TaxID=387090 RepID=UPI0022E2656A|nr:BF3164 family lipoprotein [Phocaeicola coprophilus]
MRNVDLKGEVVLSDSMLGISSPVYIQVVDTMWVTVNLQGDTLVDVWGASSRKRLNSFIAKGDGPLEFRRIDSFRADEKTQSLYMYDIYKRRLFKVAYSDLLQPKPAVQEVFSWNLEDNTPFSLMGTVRADNYFIATNITDTASYVVKEPDGNIKAIGKFPDKNHVDPAMTNMCNATLYDLTMTVAPDNQKIAVSCHLADMLQIIKVDKGRFPIQTEINAYPNDIYLMPTGDGEMQGLVTAKTKRYYIGIAATDDYIYAIWHGDVLPEGNKGYLNSSLVRVFNWEGKECYQLHLDRSIFYLTVTPDNKTLMALTDKGEGISVLKYEMDLP